jgi:hypothetical protein
VHDAKPIVSQSGSAPALGRQLSVHRSGRSNIVAGYVLATLATVGGLCVLFTVARAVWEANFELPWHSDFGWSWFAIFVGILASVLIAGIGMFISWTTRSLQSQVTIVHENGLHLEDRSESIDVLWTDLVEVVEIDVYERIPVLSSPANMLLPRWKSKRCEVSIRGELHPRNFDGNSIHKISRFVSTLRTACRKHGIVMTQRSEREP